MEKKKYFELVVSSLSHHHQKVHFQGRENELRFGAITLLHHIIITHTYIVI